MGFNLEEAMYGIIGADDCHKVGIMGGCGLTCWVYQEGRCEVYGELEDRITTEEERKKHQELYGLEFTYDEFIEKLLEDGEYDCSCHINPPCDFCIEGAVELYEEYCKENDLKPIY